MQRTIQNPNNGAPNAGQLPAGGIDTIYQTWIQGIMAGVGTRVFNGITQMIGYWNTQAGGAAVPQNVCACRYCALAHNSRIYLQVNVNYGTLLTGNANNQITGNDLTVLTAFVQNNPITWINQL